MARGRPGSGLSRSASAAVTPTPTPRASPRVTGLGAAAGQSAGAEHLGLGAGLRSPGVASGRAADVGGGEGGRKARGARPSGPLKGGSVAADTGPRTCAPTPSPAGSSARPLPWACRGARAGALGGTWRADRNASSELSRTQPSPHQALRAPQLSGAASRRRPDLHGRSGAPQRQPRGCPGSSFLPLRSLPAPAPPRSLRSL